MIIYWNGYLTKHNLYGPGINGLFGTRRRLGLIITKYQGS